MTRDRPTADPADATDSGERGRQFLSFCIDGRTYGVDVADVREIRQWAPVTPLPERQLDTLGVLNLRGTIVSVLDLRVRFDAPSPEPTPTNVVIIVEAAGRTTGLLVDTVCDILDVQEDELSAVPAAAGLDRGTQCLRHIVARDDGMVGILDVAALTGDPVEA
ncbi:chemotaxis protein CheW [Roseobacter sp. HKCCA0434]|uniref:chemotaxis protein CheW n=1 Tax=Roseobacter sp. HKCCA0434 TaxID=3079297 RepID=UPI002905DE9E|nr:chemotaxis protein CheW [Roseobacter sp. HKCCA0434]